MASDKRRVTLEELAKHCEKDDCWLAIRDVVYDVTDFAPRHPGGAFLYLGAGRDATHMFDSYHPLYVEKSMLGKMAIGTLVQPDDVNDRTSMLPRSNFLPTLKERTELYLLENHLNPKFHLSMVFKTLFILATVALTYYGAYYQTRSILMCIVFAAVLGVAWGNVGTNVMHDGNHGAYTSSGTLTRLVGITCDFVMGASSYVWLYQHVVGHHVHTNVIGLDPDIRTGEPDLRRIHREQGWYPRYIWQHVYAVFLYGLLTFKWFPQDFTNLAEGTVYLDKMQAFDTKEKIIFFGGKAWFLTYTVVIPLLLGVPGIQVMVILVTAGLAESWWLALFFQVNHVTDKAHFVPAEERHEWDWAELQVAGSTDFSAGSMLWNNISGGLSHQIEHHLFPGICHMYYAPLAKMVETTAAEYGVPYAAYASFPKAIQGHINHLHNLGIKPEIPDAH